MVSCCSRVLAALLFLIVFVGAEGLAPLLPARRVDSEEDLLARIQREQNRVRKAKYQIRLGQVKFQQAIVAYGRSDFEQGEKLLNDYLERMRESWDTLKTSGRDAVRKPQGFRELDIALRENARLLVDLQHRVPYNDRSPVDHAAQEVDRMRSEVLAALFPRGPSGGTKWMEKKRAPHSGIEAWSDWRLSH